MKPPKRSCHPVNLGALESNKKKRWRQKGEGRGRMRGACGGEGRLATFPTCRAFFALVAAALPPSAFFVLWSAISRTGMDGCPSEMTRPNARERAEAQRCPD